MLDTAVLVPDGGFPMPAGRQHDVAARWTGFLEPPQAGDYDFFVRADDGARLWLDGALIVDAWRPASPVEYARRVRLEKGRHSLRVAYRQTSARRSLSVQWQGPGLSRRQSDGAHLRTPPAAADIGAVREAIGNLAGAGGIAAEKAKRTLRTYDALARVWMRHAAAHGDAAHSAAAAALLKELGGG